MSNRPNSKPSSIPIKSVKNRLAPPKVEPKSSNDDDDMTSNHDLEPNKLYFSKEQEPTGLKMNSGTKLQVKSILIDSTNNNHNNQNDGQHHHRKQVTIMETPDENGNTILMSDNNNSSIIKNNNDLNKDNCSLNQIDPEKEEEGPSLLSTLICEAADGVLVTNTITNILGCIDTIVQNVKMAVTENGPEDVQGGQARQSEIGDIFDVDKGMAQKIFSYLRLADKKQIRLVCRRWKLCIEECQLLSFQVNLTRSTLQTLQSWTITTPMDKMVAFDLLDVDEEVLKKLDFLHQSLKELQVESFKNHSKNNEKKDFERCTIGEKNLIALLKSCPHLQSLIFHEGAIGNFGLELVNQVNKDENEVAVGWQWPQLKVKDKMFAVSTFLNKILGDLDFALNHHDSDDMLVPPGHELIPSDPPVIDVKYQDNPPPPISAFTTLATVQLDKLEDLSVTVQPTKTTEKIGLIALLHVLTFPFLRSFSVTCQEFIPDEALYRSIFMFILKHKSTLRFLTFINPVLSTKINASPTMLFHLSGLEKVKLREMTVAWELPIGLDIFWSNGHYLLEVQRRLEKLEFHSTNVARVESAICNNFRYLTTAYIDVTDTMDTQFDCSCFTLCAKLKTLVIRVSLTVQMKNVTKIPDTLHYLHWDAMYTRQDVLWFSRFLILAKSIYLYHDKNVPMDIFTPFTLTDFVHFIRLPSLEQLYLPRIQVQDPRVTKFCQRHNELYNFNNNNKHGGGGGLRQEKDIFFIDRNVFTFNEALMMEIKPTVDEWASSTSILSTISCD